VVTTQVLTVSWSRGAAVAASVVVALAGTAVQAASEVEVGSFQDRALQSAQRDRLGPSSTPSRSGAQLRVRTTPEQGSALTAFTPRLGGLGLAISGRRHSEASLLVEDQNPAPDRLQIGVGDSAEIAGWEVGLAATADVGRTSTTDGGSSTMMVGGELAVSRLRLDAAVGRDSTLLGEEGQRITAGVGYDFGRLDTHMSYSLVESEQQATNTGLLTMGSSLALSSGVVLNGDLAIADEDGRDATTAGRVSLRLNF
jgi:hypothetical protein